LYIIYTWFLIIRVLFIKYTLLLLVVVVVVIHYLTFLPSGLVFLSFRSETKRALLPNEVTSLDTVRALFVRSFSECLSMQWFDIPSHKIYILDHKTNVFYELDDVR